MTVNDLALSAVQGKIENGQPELTWEELLTGQWDSYLDADKKPQLLTAANVAINGKGVEAERLHKAQERALKTEREAVQNQFITKLTDGRLTVPDILASNLEPTGEGGKEHYINMIAKREKDLSEKPTKTKPSVMQDLFSRIHAQEGDPRRLTSEQAIDDAYLSGDVSFTDVGRLRAEYKDIRTDEGGKFSTQKKTFFDAIKPQLDNSNLLMRKLDSQGAHENYRFQQFVDAKITEYRKEGKDPRVLLVPRDGESLVSWAPRSSSAVSTNDRRVDAGLQ